MKKASHNQRAARMLTRALWRVEEKIKHISMNNKDNINFLYVSSNGVNNDHVRDDHVSNFDKANEV